MFLWTSIAHMALPLGEAGIGEIPNESAVLSTMQSSIGDQTGLYIFPGLGVEKNASRQEKNEAMKHMNEKIAANPSGILVYHAPGRPFAFGKALGIEFATELLEAICLCSCSPRHALGASLAGSVSFWWPEFWPRLPPTFLIGIGTVFPAFMSAAICLSRLSVFSLLGSSPRWCCGRPHSEPRLESVSRPHCDVL